MNPLLENLILAVAVINLGLWSLTELLEVILRVLRFRHHRRLLKLRERRRIQRALSARMNDHALRLAVLREKILAAPMAGLPTPHPPHQTDGSIFLGQVQQRLVLSHGFPTRQEGASGQPLSPAQVEGLLAALHGAAHSPSSGPSIPPHQNAATEGSVPPPTTPGLATDPWPAILRLLPQLERHGVSGNWPGLAGSLADELLVSRSQAYRLLEQKSVVPVPTAIAITLSTSSLYAAHFRPVDESEIAPYLAGPRNPEGNAR